MVLWHSIRFGPMSIGAMCAALSRLAARTNPPAPPPDAMFPPIATSCRVPLAALAVGDFFFAPGGNWGGVAELSHLVDEPGALLRNQYGPSVYDHAPTLHGFLSIYSLLKPLPVAMELCRLADCIALPVSPEIDLDTNMPAAVGNAALAMSTLTGVTQALSQGSRLDAEARSKARDAVFEVVAFASALLARIDPAAMIAPSPQLDEDAFAAAVQVSFSD